MVVALLAAKGPVLEGVGMGAEAAAAAVANVAAVVCKVGGEDMVDREVVPAARACSMRWRSRYRKEDRLNSTSIAVHSR